MPLTRNLYELDEVISALQLCLLKGWCRALFWLYELVVSKEEMLAQQTLMTVWLRAGGGYDPFLFQDPRWPARGQRVLAAIKTARSLNAVRFLERTATLQHRPAVTPLAATPAIEKRRNERAAAFVASLTPDEMIDPSDAAHWWISLDSACRQHSRTDAIWLLQAAQPILSADAIWSALVLAGRGSPLTHKAIACLHEQSAVPVHQVLAQTNALLILCTPTKERESTMFVKPADLPSNYNRDWVTWMAATGRRAARIQEIPTEALHSETTRGSMPFKYTNIGDVRDPVALLSEGCCFWQETLQAAGITVEEDTGAIQFPDDDVLELFYEHYFPDDIPDEWSTADQQKSHGRGCQEKAAPSLLPELAIREERVSGSAWNIGIHVRKAMS